MKNEEEIWNYENKVDIFIGQWSILFVAMVLMAVAVVTSSHGSMVNLNSSTIKFARLDRFSFLYYLSISKYIYKKNVLTKMAESFSRL